MCKRLLIFMLSIIALTVVLGLLPIHGETSVYENVVRLHVLANSDSVEDQELKLKVRDAVLEKTQKLFSDCSSKTEAQNVLEESLELIEQTALNAIAENGYDYTVSVLLGEEKYPTRNYESCCFPSGSYLSLRIMIGEARGQNWWCVLFPPLCLNAASEGQAFTQVGLTGEQYNIITQTEKPKYKVRFKILEAIDKGLNGK